MKLKLLLVPTIIVLVIILGIWIIYPAYSNGSDGVKDRYDQLKAEQAKLESVRGKGDNVNALTAQLDKSSAEKGVLYGFVPTNMKESEIIKTLSQMASDSGLLVYNLSINQPVLSASNLNATVTMGGSLDANAAGASGSADATAAPIMPSPKNFETDMGVIGNYSQIKDLLGKLNNFSRYNQIASVTLRRNIDSVNVATTNTPSTQTNVLMADMKINFNILDKSTLSDSNAGDAVFSSGNLDMKIVSQIKASRGISAIGLDTGQTGKADPFTP